MAAGLPASHRVESDGEPLAIPALSGGGTSWFTVVPGSAGLQLLGRYPGLHEVGPSDAIILAQSTSGAQFKFGHSDDVRVQRHSAAATPLVVVGAIKEGPVRQPIGATQHRPSFVASS
jgi:hypothetical protein